MKNELRLNRVNFNTLAIRAPAYLGSIREPKKNEYEEAIRKINLAFFKEINSKSFKKQKAENYISFYEKIKELNDSLNKTKEDAENAFNRLSKEMQDAEGRDAKISVLKKIRPVQDQKIKINDAIESLKKEFYITTGRLHMLFAIPPKEISDLMESLAYSRNVLVDFYCYLYSIHRSHNSTDLESLKKGLEIIETYPDDVNDDCKFNLYCNLASAYETFDFTKALEYINIALDYATDDFKKQEALCDKAEYSIYLGKKKEFNEIFKLISDPQKQFDLRKKFIIKYRKETAPKIKANKIKNAEISESDSAVREIINQSVKPKSSKALPMESFEAAFHTLMKTEASACAQKYLAAQLRAMPSKDALDFLNKMNAKYHLLRDDSIFNPMLLFQEVYVYTKNKKYDEAIQKFNELMEKLQPYEDNIRSVEEFVNHAKSYLILSLILEQKFDDAKSILKYCSKDEVDELKLLVNVEKDIAKRKEHTESDNKFEGDDIEKVSEANSSNSIELPSNVQEFTKQVSLGLIPLNDLSASLTHAYFMCKKSMMYPNNVQNSGQESSIDWKVGELIYSYPSENDKLKVVCLNGVPNNYITIHPDLLELDSEREHMQAAKDVLETGRVARMKGHQGVRLLNNKVFELKMLGQQHGDFRLFTNKVYDTGGNRLIVFDQNGNHKKVKDFLRQTKSLVTEFSDQEDENLVDDAFKCNNDINDCQTYYTEVLGSDGNQVVIDDYGS